MLHVTYYNENDLDKRCRNLDIKGRNMGSPRSFGQICSEFLWHYCVFSSLKIACTWKQHCASLY